MRDVIRYLLVQVIDVFFRVVDRILCLFAVIKNCFDTSLDVVSGHLEHSADLVAESSDEDFGTDLLVIAEHAGVKILEILDTVISSLLVGNHELNELNDELAERKQYDRRSEVEDKVHVRKLSCNIIRRQGSYPFSNRKCIICCRKDRSADYVEHHVEHTCSGSVSGTSDGCENSRNACSDIKTEDDEHRLVETHELRA